MMELCKNALCLPGNEHMVVNDSQKTQKAGMDVPPPEKRPLLPGPLKKYLKAETLSVHSVFKIVYFESDFEIVGVCILKFFNWGLIS